MTETLKPLLVRGHEARRLIGVGVTKYHELVNKGIIERVYIDGTPFVVFASLERLVNPEKKAA